MAKKQPTGPPKKGQLRRPSFTEALRTSTAAMGAGLVQGMGEVVTIPADIISAPARALKSGWNEFQRVVNSPEDMTGAQRIGHVMKESVTGAMQMPRTEQMQRTGDTLERELNHMMGISDPENIINDVGTMSNRLAGNVIAPGWGEAATIGKVKGPPKWTPRKAELGPENPYVERSDLELHDLIFDLESQDVSMDMFRRELEPLAQEWNARGLPTGPGYQNDPIIRGYGDAYPDTTRFYVDEVEGRMPQPQPQQAPNALIEQNINPNTLPNYRAMTTQELNQLWFGNIPDLNTLYALQGELDARADAGDELARQALTLERNIHPIVDAAPHPADPEMHASLHNDRPSAADGAPGDWFYDNAERAMSEWPQGKGTPEQVLAHLRKYKGASEEAEQIGLVKWLTGPPAMNHVRKDEVLSWIEQNKLVPYEQVRRDVDMSNPSEAAFHRESQELLNRAVLGEVNWEDYPNLQAQLVEKYGVVPLPKPKYDSPSYVLPGGTNYTERIIGAPTNRNLEYYSPHWEEQRNNLLHLRTTDRTLPDGRKILFAEELQSDPHQKGSKIGYEGEPSPAPIARWKELNESLGQLEEGLYWLREKLHERRSRGEDYGDLDAEIRHIEMKQRDMEREKDELGLGDYPDIVQPPPLPLQGDAWKRAGLRRLMSLAAEGDYAGFGWTPGSVHAQRYGHGMPPKHREGIQKFYDNVLPTIMNKEGKQYGLQAARTQVPHGLLPAPHIDSDPRWERLDDRQLEFALRDYQAAGRTVIVDQITEELAKRRAAATSIHYVDMPPSVKELIRKNKLPLWMFAPGVLGLTAAATSDDATGPPDGEFD